MNIPNSDNGGFPQEPEKNSPVSDIAGKILDFSELYQEQRQFFELLYTEPKLARLQGYWTMKPSPRMDEEQVTKALKVLSSGESHLLRFLAGVWLGSNTFEFDLIGASRDLDTPELKIIQNWLKSPFFP